MAKPYEVCVGAELIVSPPIASQCVPSAERRLNLRQPSKLNIIIFELVDAAANTVGYDIMPMIKQEPEDSFEMEMPEMEHADQ